MSELLIAYNNAPNDEMHDVFEACADMAKSICAKHNVKFESLTPPSLTEKNVCGKMEGFQMLFIASHGSDEAIFNENYDEVTSLHTTNYSFSGKGFYTISCSTAKKLKPELQRIGLKLFVGYDDNFYVTGDINPFCECALAGLDYFLSGDTLGTAREKMMDLFDKRIIEFRKSAPKTSFYLNHNKVHICFEGDSNLTYDNLK